MDLKFRVKNPKTGITTEYTNREWIAKKNNPYVKDSNGNAVPTNQHHIDQRASGPIIEIEEPIHKSDSQNLHPYSNKKNPNDPVDHKEWNKDRRDINDQRHN